MPGDVQAWIYSAAGTVLALAGISMAGWALFWDRARGRKRCPKCWYSLEGVTGNRCPECGRVSAARTLLCTRRRWGWAGVGLILTVVASQAFQQTRRRGEGWTRYIPSTVLVALAHDDNPFQPGIVMRTLGQRTTVLWDWQRRVAQWRDWRATAADLRAIPVTRDRWPEGVPIRIWLAAFPENLVPNVGWAGVEVRCALAPGQVASAGVHCPEDRTTHCFFGGSPRMLTLPAMPPGEQDLALEVRYRGAGSPELVELVHLRVRVGGSAAECVGPVASGEVAEVLRACLRVSFEGEDRKWTGTLDWRVEMKQFWNDRISFYPRVELIENGRVAGRLDWEDYEDPYSGYFVRVDSDGRRVLNDGLGVPITAGELVLEGARVRFTGWPDIALNNLWPRSYWSGQFEVPASELFRPE